ncbi:MAG: nickel pincer cofactor biosynthesis protein LarB [Streptosporangiaceae bacterium]
MEAAQPGEGAALPLGFATVDLDRQRRQGLPEVVYAPGKQPAEIAAIAAALLARTCGPVLVTRLEPGPAAEVAAEMTAARVHGAGVQEAGVQEAEVQGAGVQEAEVAAGDYDARARLLCWRPAPPDGWRVAVVTAGTADGPVADEAAAVARATGLQVAEFRDVGVAGLHRLLAAAEDIAAADVVIVIAGMEGALASAVAGLVGVPVVAVPTSTGYGAALDGITALLAMMTSCAAGVCVVNIDSGFGAAMAAHRLAFTMRRRAR